MNIPLVDLKAQYNSIKSEIDAAIQRVIQSRQFILGPEVKAFEDEMAAYCGTKFEFGEEKAKCSRCGKIYRKEGEEIITVREVRKMKFSRITVEPEKMGGVPSIRGLRIPVATVVGMIADGMSRKEILKAYPDLEEKDIKQALKYAAEAVRERELPLVSAP
jgi:uncharacterized protein (DUF433 family)